MSWSDIPAVLRAFDNKPGARVSEPLTVQLLWSLLLYVPSLAPSLGLPRNATWYNGGRGVADLQARSDDRTILAQVEVKSNKAAWNWSVHCENNCGVVDGQSQLLHFVEHDGPIVVVTQSRRVPLVCADIEDLELGARVTVLSFDDLARKVAKALKRSGEPDTLLLACLYDVEEVVAAAPRASGASSAPDAQPAKR